MYLIVIVPNLQKGRSSRFHRQPLPSWRPGGGGEVGGVTGVPLPPRNGKGGGSSPPNRRHKPRTAVMSDRTSPSPSTLCLSLSFLHLSVACSCSFDLRLFSVFQPPPTESEDHVGTNGPLPAFGGGAIPSRLGSALFHPAVPPEGNQRRLHPERLQDTNSKGWQSLHTGNQCCHVLT